jgi:hypothetical protein
MTVNFSIFSTNKKTRVGSSGRKMNPEAEKIQNNPTG